MVIDDLEVEVSMEVVQTIGMVLVGTTNANDGVVQVDVQITIVEAQVQRSANHVVRIKETQN